MNIWLPIITNLILLGCFVFDFIFSKKVGLRPTIIRLISTVGLGVGLYFLSPIILKGLPFLTNIGLSELGLKAFLISSIALVVNTIQCIVFYIIYRKNKYEHIESVNTAKIKRAKAIDKKAEKSIRREERKARKLARVPRVIKKSKANKVFTIIFSVILSLIMSALVYVQIKAVITYVDTKYDIEQIETGYEYTPFGQLDKLI